MNPKSFRLDVDELEHDELLLHLLFFLDSTFFRALLSKNLSNTCRIVECFLSNGFGNIFRAHCTVWFEWVWYDRPIVGRLQNYKVKFRCGQLLACLIQLICIYKSIGPFIFTYIHLISCSVRVFFIFAAFLNEYKIILLYF